MKIERSLLSSRSSLSDLHNHSHEFSMISFLPGPLTRVPSGMATRMCTPEAVVPRVQFSSVQSLSRVRLFATP